MILEMVGAQYLGFFVFLSTEFRESVAELKIDEAFACSSTLILCFFCSVDVVYSRRETLQ